MSEKFYALAATIRVLEDLQLDRVGWIMKIARKCWCAGGSAHRASRCHKERMVKMRIKISTGLGPEPEIRGLADSMVDRTGSWIALVGLE